MAGLKQNLGLDPNERFALPEQVLEHTRAQAGQRGAELHAAWEKRFEAWGQANPQALELLERVRAGLLPAELDDVLPVSSRALACPPAQPVARPCRLSPPHCLNCGAALLTWAAPT